MRPLFKKNKLKQATGTLRNNLILWFLLFSLVPVIFVTGFSLQQSRSALDKELYQRINGNARELELTLGDIDKILSSKTEKLAGDRTLTFYLSTGKNGEINTLLTDWLATTSAARISAIQPDGKIIASAFRDSDGKVKAENLSGDKEFFVTEAVANNLKDNPRSKLIEAQKNKLELTSYYPVFSKSGKITGYLENVLSLQQEFLQAFKIRMNLELALMTGDYKVITSTHDDLLLYTQSFFRSIKGEFVGKLFDANIRSVPHGFMVYPLKWGTGQLYIILAASKADANTTLKNIKAAFFGVFVTVVFLVMILTWIASNVVVRPIRELYEGIRRMNQGEEGIELPVRGDNEMTYLSMSFNEMTMKIKQARDDLRSKILELETANKEIKNTQVQLVHSAKMASLGQLVAGIAHELNNPIGFIYSNLSQLEDYSQKLVKMIEEISGLSDKTDKVEKSKTENDFNYIRDDLPKLLKSCQDGARRTREIVIGLRNFSRLEEATLKEADVNECIEETIRLLAGEMKGRIQVNKNFGRLPNALCYPSNLNQVFMNILSNAAHAIDGNGTIDIKTWLDKFAGEDFVFVSIKDSGKGMSKEVREKIFEPFFSTKNVGEGTGLGMSISFGIIKKHDGDIEVESTPGKGSTFIIKIPLKGPQEFRH